MTSKELLGCLKDRPCDVCKFRDEHGCHRWTCVFEEPTPMTYLDKAEIVISQLREDRDRLLKAIDDIRTEIGKELCHSIRDEYSQRQNDYCDGVEFAGKRCLEIIDRHIGDKADETDN